MNGQAFGHPGIEPRWTRGNKDAIGTAYSASSRIWFTLADGIVNEVYFPTIDRPQIRDLQYMVTDGESFVHDERRHLTSTTSELSDHVLGYEIINADPQGRYRIVKQILSDPHYACLLVHTRFEADEQHRDKLRLFALLAPHLGAGGWGNSGYVYRAAGRDILVAHKGDLWLAMAASVPVRPLLLRIRGLVRRLDRLVRQSPNGLAIRQRGRRQYRADRRARYRKKS